MSYDSIAPFYDAENAGFVEDIEAYLRLAEDTGGPILEVGCGTGRVALALAANGYPVTGVDRSEAMLARARTRPNTGVTWVRADIGDLALGEVFALVLFTYSGFNHLLSADAQIEALAALLRHTKPGGTLVLDLLNPIFLIGSDDPTGFSVERVFTDEHEQTVIQQTFSRLDHAAQRMDVTYVYDVTGADGLLRRTLAELSFRLAFLPELRLLLKEAARQADTPLAVVAAYGDYNFLPYASESARLFVVCERAP
ncbi:MAG: class I SAM-dependent methyltransferase [Anaerolineae bacterium]